jgi:hypothetical protein
MSDDDARAGEQMAKAWLRGEGELIDDLPLLVSGMSRPLDEMAKAFLSTIGNAAKAKARPTPAGAPAPARLDQTAAQPTPEAPLSRPVSLDELWRRRQERNREQRLDELGRRNAEAFADQARMIHRMGWER